MEIMKRLLHILIFFVFATCVKGQRLFPAIKPNNSPYVFTNSEAQAYITNATNAGGSFTNTNKAALDVLVSAIKSEGVFANLTVYWPYGGGTSASSAIEFFNNYNITWNGSILFSQANGVRSDGGTGYGTTSYNPSTQLSTTGLTVFSSSLSNANEDKADFGAGESGALLYVRSRMETGGVAKGVAGDDAGASVSQSTSVGRTTIKRSGTTLTLFKNGSLVSTNSSYSGSLPNRTLDLLGLNHTSGHIQLSSKKQGGVWVFNTALTNTQIANIDAAIATFEAGWRSVNNKSLRDKLQPFGGSTVLTPAGNPGSISLINVAENSIVVESDGSVKIYHSQIEYSGGVYYNRVGVATPPNMDVSSFDSYVYSTPLIGEGYGGAGTLGCSASTVFKEGSTYYAFGLDGYGTNVSETQEIYQYRSTDGYTFTYYGKAFAKGTYGSGIGVVNAFGNTCVALEKSESGVYVPKKTADNKYYGNVDIFSDAGIWETVRWEASSLDGPFTLTGKCTDLQVASGKMYGSADWVYSGGLTHCFYHYTPATWIYGGPVDGNLPTMTGYATSTDYGLTWTKREFPIISLDANPFSQPTDQGGTDACVREVNGKTYLLGSMQYNGTPVESQLKRWTYNGTFDQFVDTD